MVELVEIISTVKKNIILLICLSLLVIYPFLGGSSYAIYVLTVSFIFSIAAVGWNICYGYAGLLSFGHSAFFGMSAYVCVILFKSYFLTPWIGIIIGAIVGAIFGIVIAWLTTRTRGWYFSITTTVLPQILVILFTWFWRYTGGSYGLPLPYMGENFFYMQFNSKTPYYLISLSVLVLCLIGIKIMDASKLGHYLKALGRDEEAAESIGIDAYRMRLYAMGISSFIVGIAGGLYANLIHFIDPYEAFGWTMNLYFILSTMIGGVGTIIGPVLGGLILIPSSELIKLNLEQLFGQRFIGLHFIIYGIILMFMIFRMPYGVYPSIKKFLKKIGLVGD